MFSTQQYELLDFGHGRKLERLGGYLVDRPAPAVEHASQRRPELWSQADACFRRDTGQGSGQWEHATEPPSPWRAQHDRFCLDLHPSELGNVGVFVEQAPNWDWIMRQLTACDGHPEVLNLFAYTGGSTLAAASAGARVVHVDAAQSTVARARRNAENSGLSEAPIRWIVDDALKFVERELRRGRRYDAIILDPPSYGHGRRGAVWQVEQDLPTLLDRCAELTDASSRFMLLTCHTPGYGTYELEHLMSESLGSAAQGALRSLDLGIETLDGRRLPCGVAVRWQPASC